MRRCQAAQDHVNCYRAIPMLRTFALAFRDEPAGKVRDANVRVGADVLPAWGTAHQLNFQIFVSNIHVSSLSLKTSRVH